MRVSRWSLGVGVVALFALLALAVPRHGLTIATGPPVSPGGEEFDAQPPAEELLADLEKMPPGAMARARAAVQAMIKREHRTAASSPEDRAATTGARASTWRPLGPSNLGGRTHGLVIDPRNPDVMYAGGIGGGVWKTTNAGKDWNPLNDTLSNIAIGTLEMDPKNPDMIYAGTGDIVEVGGRTSAIGAGIMKTTDAGAHWEFLPQTQQGDFEAVSAIKVSHNDSKRIYATSNTGVWRSSDAGQTWSPIYEATSYGGCTDLAIRTDVTPDTLIFSCGGLYGETEGVFRSTDGGDSYEQVVGQVNKQPAGRTALAFAPNDQNIVYASVSTIGEPGSGADAHALGLLRSDQAGAPGSWTIQNDGSGARPGTPAWLSNCWRDSPVGTGQGAYGNVIAVDPVNPDRFWVGGVDLYRSDDAGKTLGIASYWWLYYSQPFNTDLSGTQYVHADHHVIVFSPRYDGQQNQTIFFGNDGGVFKTDNGTASVGPSPYAKCEEGAESKVGYRELNSGYVTSLFREGTVSNDGTIVAGGLQDNGSWLDTDITPQPNAWLQIGGGDGSAIAMDPSGQTVYWTSQYGTIVRTTDQGKNGELATTGIQDRGAFFSPLEMDPNDPKVLWSGRAKMWRTTDGARTWAAASLDFPGDDYGSQVQSIAIAPTNSNVVYAGTGYPDGKLWATTSALASPPSWVDVSGPMKKWEVSAIAVDPNDPKTAYAAIDTFKYNEPRLWKTTDGGASWTDATGVAPTALPPAAGLSVAINPTNPSMVYVGTATGIFESLDGGTTWHVANENLATTGVEDLYFVSGTSELYAFTYGRGVYRVDVGSQTPPPNDAIANAIEVSLSPAFKDKVNTRLATTEAGDPSVQCGAPGQPQQAKSVWYRFAPPDGSTYSISTEDSNYDTVVAVFSENAGSLTPVACDDDGLGEAGNSLVKLQATPGTAYFIEVTRSSDASQEGISGSLTLTVERSG